MGNGAAGKIGLNIWDDVLMIADRKAAGKG